MATIIWCDHVRHIVEEPRSQVQDAIQAVQRAYFSKSEYEITAELGAVGETTPVDHSGRDGFVFFTPINAETQRAFNVTMISTFEAFPGDGV